MCTLHPQVAERMEKTVFAAGELMGNRGLTILLSGRDSNFVAIREEIGSRDFSEESFCVLNNTRDMARIACAKGFGLAAIYLPLSPAFAVISRASWAATGFAAGYRRA